MVNLLKIVQWNCRSAVSNKSELTHLINKYDPFIIALAETWLTPSFAFNVNNYFCLREDRIDGYGGVALLIKSSCSFNALAFPSHHNGFSIVGAIVDHICYISVYVPHPPRLFYKSSVLFSLLLLDLLLYLVTLTLNIYLGEVQLLIRTAISFLILLILRNFAY